MATPPPPQGGPGFGGFPQQQPPQVHQPQQPPQQPQHQQPHQTPPPGGTPGFGPPPGLPTSPGMPPVEADRRGRRGGGLRRNAVWAFTGALIVSAGWAAAVFTLPGMVQSGGSARPIRGYHVVDDLCSAAKPGKFQSLYTMVDTNPYHYSARHTDMDVMSCTADMKRGATSSDWDYALIEMRANLHKSVDSAPEFTATKAAFQQRKAEISAVPGLGDEAYLAYIDERRTTSKSRTWHSARYELQVRDGGMTFSLAWSATYDDDGPKPVDKETVRQSLLSDGRDALKAIGGP